MVVLSTLSVPTLDSTNKIERRFLPDDLATEARLRGVEDQVTAANNSAASAITAASSATEKASSAVALAQNGTSVVVQIATASGFVAPDWGVTPTAKKASNLVFVKGQIARNTADFTTNTTLVTGGAWLANEKIVVNTSSGLALIRTTATTIEFDRVLSGSSPVWISFDGLVISGAA